MNLFPQSQLSQLSQLPWEVRENWEKLPAVPVLCNLLGGRGISWRLKRVSSALVSVGCLPLCCEGRNLNRCIVLAMNNYETMYPRTSVAGLTAARALAWRLSLFSLRTAKRHNRVRPGGVRTNSIAGAKGFQGFQVSRKGTGNPGIVDNSSQMSGLTRGTARWTKE